MPATSANLGPGYDTLGLAIAECWTELRVSRAGASSACAWTFEGEGADEFPPMQTLDDPQESTNLVVVGLREGFRAAAHAWPRHLTIHCTNAIPLARGMGSSAAALVAGLVAGWVLAGHAFTDAAKHVLLQRAAAIEGHADNVAPALFGGIQLGFQADARWHCRALVSSERPPELVLTLVIPDTKGETRAARAVLADSVSRRDAVFNLGRVALWVHALVTNTFADLKVATADRLHQPTRGREQYPHLRPAIEAALAAGAYGCYLSGAGPAVCALTAPGNGPTVGAAMQRAAAHAGVASRVLVRRLNARGTQVTVDGGRASRHAR